MDLSIMPQQLLEDAVLEGNIYFFEKDVTFGVPAHMHVRIKRADKLLFFSTCSSQINTAERLSECNGWDINTFPVYKANLETNKFREPLTYVNCNECHEISVSDFVDLMQKGKVRLLQGHFSESDMLLIAKGVLASTQIARGIKQLFRIKELCQKRN